MRERLRVRVVAAAILLCPVAAFSAERALSVVAMGDSITQGQRPGVQWSETYPAVLGRRIPWVTVTNRGVAAETTEAAVARIDSVLGEITPVSVVLLMYGTNDSALIDDPCVLRWRKGRGPRVALDRYRANLSVLVERVIAEGATPVIVTPPPLTDGYVCACVPPYAGDVNFALREYVAAARDVALERNLVLVDLFTKLEQGPFETLDGVHPGPKLLAWMADEIAREVVVKRKVLRRR